MKNKIVGSILVSLLTVTMAACSRSVSVEAVRGTYVASYPFGTETITLKPDGTFKQLVEIKKQKPVTVEGTWEFDSQESRITLSGSMVVVDGFDRLRNDWRVVEPGIVSLDVERRWSRILMASAAKYPYVKQ